MKYKLVVCGGTFDHFHYGHAAFLHATFAISEKVLLGITSDLYIQQNKMQNMILQQFTERKKALTAFLKKEQVLNRVTIAQIDSILYPKEWEALPIEAIVVTEETKKGADIINQHRETNGLLKLPVYVIPLLADDTGEKIASTNIRGGKINNAGISYMQPSWFAKDLLLPEVEKQWFKKPFGELHPNNTFLLQENPRTLVTVGDVVTKDANTISIHQKLSVIDFTVQRKHAFQHIRDLGFTGKEQVLYTRNPASHITAELFQTIMQSIADFSEDLPAARLLVGQGRQKKQIIIIVDGEEDLAVIPLVLSLPLGFVIVYGQPNRGIVRLQITPQIKNYAYKLLQRFVQTRGH